MKYAKCHDSISDKTYLNLRQIDSLLKYVLPLFLFRFSLPLVDFECWKKKIHVVSLIRVYVWVKMAGSSDFLCFFCFSYLWTRKNKKKCSKQRTDDRNEKVLFFVFHVFEPLTLFASSYQKKKYIVQTKWILELFFAPQRFSPISFIFVAATRRFF